MSWANISDDHTIADFANQQFEWRDKALTSGSCRRAGGIAIQAIRALTKTGHAPDIAPIIFDLKIFFNALRDIANFLAITTRDGWLEHPKAVDEAWRLANDAETRLSLVRGMNQSHFAPYRKQILAFFEIIRERFGEGLYSSWEVEFEKIVCTVCELDTRECVHVPGRWYDGVLCRQRVDKSKLLSISIVRNPRLAMSNMAVESRQEHWTLDECLCLHGVLGRRRRRRRESCRHEQTALTPQNRVGTWSIQQSAGGTRRKPASPFFSSPH
jgi:hypothetical protein